VPRRNARRFSPKKGEEEPIDRAGERGFEGGDLSDSLVSFKGGFLGIGGELKRRVGGREEAERSAARWNWEGNGMWNCG
jgi:hypothetical protein